MTFNRSHIKYAYCEVGDFSAFYVKRKRFFYGARTVPFPSITFILIIIIRYIELIIFIFVKHINSYEYIYILRP